MGLSLEKKTELVRLSLAKRNVPSGIQLAVKAVIDVSVSFQPLFGDGTVQELVDRLIPVGVRFDDDGSIESYAFGTDAKKLNDITAKDFGHYIDNKFLKEVPEDILWSGTRYSTALKLVNKGLGGGFFGKKVKPSYVMFITDGDTNGDERDTEEIIKKMADRQVYIQLIGVGRGSTFDFLKLMADLYDHVGFVTFPDLARTSDETLYTELLGEELCEWVKLR